MEKVLIKTESPEQAHLVFDKLKEIGEKINRNRTVWCGVSWSYVGFLKSDKEWIIAENRNKSFEHSKIITAEEFLNQEKEYQYEIY